MNTAPQASSKVSAAHLRRGAYLYVRQSTIKQVLTNTESALRQYDLRGRAIAFGWSSDQIIVIDIDQGHSGASAADRAAVRSDLNMLLALTGRERTRPCLQASPFRARTGPRALVRWQRIRIARC